jgi:hypothetical protein
MCCEYVFCTVAIAIANDGVRAEIVVGASRALAASLKRKKLLAKRRWRVRLTTRVSSVAGPAATGLPSATHQ